MIFSENRFPPRIKSGAGFFGIMLQTSRPIQFLIVAPSNQNNLAPPHSISASARSRERKSPELSIGARFRRHLRNNPDR
jgi:hypothetical protein